MKSNDVTGLVLAGGRSRRLKKDKAFLTFHDKPQVARAYELLGKFCRDVGVSVRPDQVGDPRLQSLPLLPDDKDLQGIGPVGGILTALRKSGQAVLAIACDLPLIDEDTLNELLRSRDKKAKATAYRSAYDQLPEPLCCVYEPSAKASLEEYLREGKVCPRKFLKQTQAHLLELKNPHALDNVNTPEDEAAVKTILTPGARE